MTIVSVINGLHVDYYYRKDDEVTFISDYYRKRFRMYTDAPNLNAPGNPTELSDKDKAIKLARLVCNNKNNGFSLVPSESLLLSRQFLRALGLSERG